MMDSIRLITGEGNDRPTAAGQDNDQTLTMMRTTPVTQYAASRESQVTNPIQPRLLSCSLPPSQKRISQTQIRRPIRRPPNPPISTSIN